MKASPPTPFDAEAPWRSLPRLDGAAELIDAGPILDGLFDMPEGSAMTLCKVEPETGRLLAARWRETGEQGFYPASTIKWITAAMTVRWMKTHGFNPSTVIQLGDEPATTLRDLLLDMTVMSGNAAFNTLQECVGFAETHQTLRTWGVKQSLIRRHFTRPHWNHSRAIQATTPGRAAVTLEARPAADIPLNPHAEPGVAGSGESNYFTTDDLVRAGSASLMGDTRDTPHFDLMTQGLSWTNQCYVREGLSRLTSERADHPSFVVLNKPGWWPPDGANSELCYIYDAKHHEHYFLAAYLQGPMDLARKKLRENAYRVFSALEDAKIRF